MANESVTVADADEQRNAATMENATENVSAELVGAERMTGRVADQILDRFWRSGSWGAISGAKNAVTTRRSKIPAPSASQSLSFIAHPRIDELVKKIG